MELSEAAAATARSLQLSEELDVDGLAGRSQLAILGNERERLNAEQRREDVRPLTSVGAHVPAVLVAGYPGGTRMSSCER